MTTPASHFADRLLAAIDRAGGPACVGLDPVYERLPAAARDRSAGRVEAIERFSIDVIDAVADVVPAVKAQSACFERYGHAGMAALERAAQAARDRRLLFILDAKRGDIGATSEHYAAWAFDEVGADAVTLSPYLGEDAIAPFLDRRWSMDRGRGVFVLVRTSNESAGDIQRARLEDGRTVAEMMADFVHRLGERRLGVSGYSDVGAVVAATTPEDAASLRRRMPGRIILAPGFGAQGGTAETVRDLFDDAGRGALITASRSVIYAFDGRSDRWRDSVRQAAAALAAQARHAAQARRRAY